MKAETFQISSQVADRQVEFEYIQAQLAEKNRHIAQLEQLVLSQDVEIQTLKLELGRKGKWI